MQAWSLSSSLRSSALLACGWLRFILCRVFVLNASMGHLWISVVILSLVFSRPSGLELPSSRPMPYQSRWIALLEPLQRSFPVLSEKKSHLRHFSGANVPGTDGDSRIRNHLSGSGNNLEAGAGAAQYASTSSSDTEVAHVESKLEANGGYSAKRKRRNRCMAGAGCDGNPATKTAVGSRLSIGRSLPSPASEDDFVAYLGEDSAHRKGDVIPKGLSWWTALDSQSVGRDENLFSNKWEARADVDVLAARMNDKQRKREPADGSLRVNCDGDSEVSKCDAEAFSPGEGGDASTIQLMLSAEESMLGAEDNMKSDRGASSQELSVGRENVHNGPGLPGLNTEGFVSYAAPPLYIGCTNISLIERGSLYSLSYAAYFRDENGPVSPFHDIPIFANEGNNIFNMVVEVPRWTNAKMEIATKDPLNPIKQDVKKGKLRYVANCFPHHGYIWNYGAIPQTWEDPSHIDESTECKGDNDPIDVCEIGYRVAKRGEVLQVKVLGTLALVDEGETDWKVIAVDVNDPLAPQLSDISDVEKHMPGFLKATVEWFKIYKIPDGKPENQFAFDGEAKDREFAHQIILETHHAWRNLVEGQSDADELDISSTTVENAVNKLSPDEAEEIIDASPEPCEQQSIDPKVDTWHYVTLK